MLTLSQHMGNSPCRGCVVLPLRPQSRQHPLVGKLILPVQRCTDGAGINADTVLGLGRLFAGDESLPH